MTFPASLFSEQNQADERHFADLLEQIGVHVESGEKGDYPLVNGQPIGAQARKLTDNDVLQLAGVKMGFFTS